MLNPAVLINKRIKSVKFHPGRYIKNVDEPRDNVSHDTLANDEAILIEDSPPMRRRFRVIAKKFRIITIQKRNRINQK